MGKALFFEKILAYLLYFSGLFFIYKFIVHKILRRKFFVILVYHHVVEGNEMENKCCPLKTTEVSFEKQMYYLAQNYKIISIQKLIEKIQKNNIDAPYAVITFDDGYHNNYSNAFPILKKYSFPATIFLVHDFIHTNKLLWYDQLAFIVSYTKKENVRINDFRLMFSNESDKHKTYDKLVSELMKQSDEEKYAFLKKLCEKLEIPLDIFPDKYMLKWEEIKEMQENNITFGAHTLTHPLLTQVSTEAAQKEIVNSKELLEEKLVCDILCFAYPYGGEDSFNECIKDDVKQSGFLCAVTTVSGINERSADFFALKRIGCTHINDMVLFKVKISGIMSFFYSFYLFFRKLLP